jgi:hypothetical protein
MPLRLWFWAAYLVATHHPGISAVQLQRQLGIRRHETAWMMLHKLRVAMVAPQREPLKREVEIDTRSDGFEPQAPGHHPPACGDHQTGGRRRHQERRPVTLDADGDKLRRGCPALAEGLSPRSRTARRWSLACSR